MIAIARAHGMHGHGGLHDRELDRDHRGRPLHAAGGHRGPRRRRAPGRRSVHRRHASTAARSRFPPGPASACGGDDGARSPASPCRSRSPPVHLPHSRDTGRPGRPGRPRRRARAAARDDRHRARDSTPTAPEAAARDVLAAPDDRARRARGAARHARGGWRDYYGAPIGLTLARMLPAGIWGESQVVAVRARGRWRIGGVAGEVLAWLDERGGEAAVSLGSRVRSSDRCGTRCTASCSVGAVEPPESSHPTPRARTATERVLTLHGDPPTLLERDTLFSAAPRQRELYEALETLGGSAQVRHVVEQLGFGEAVMRGLVLAGWRRSRAAERVRDPFADSAGTPPPADAHAGPAARRSRRSTGSRPARPRCCSG